MTLDEVDRIKEIDATCYIKKAWRTVNGVLTLVEINWTDYELPNGLEWHLKHYQNTLEQGGYAFGCFDEGILVGYGTLDAKLFGVESKYLLLDQLFISQEYRNKKIGRHIVAMCVKQATVLGADKLYICAGSSEDTIVFYRKIGCIPAKEMNQELLNEDPRDIQLELGVKDE